MMKNLPGENAVIEFPPLQLEQARGLKALIFGGLLMESAVHLRYGLNDLSGEISPGTEDRADA
jgi:hypothetical protein